MPVKEEEEGIIIIIIIIVTGEDATAKVWQSELELPTFDTIYKY
jgi:hypothetical protein